MEIRISKWFIFAAIGTLGYKGFVMPHQRRSRTYPGIVQRLKRTMRKMLWKRSGTRRVWRTGVYWLK